MPKPPIKQLSDLILSLFQTYDELRGFLLGLPEGEVILTAIPGKDAAVAAHADEVAMKLKSRGLIDPELFRAMIEAYPARADEIVEVAEAHIPEVSSDARASAWVVHALKREAVLLGRVTRLEAEVAGLKERVKKLDARRSAVPASEDEKWEQLDERVSRTTFDLSKLFPAQEGVDADGLRKAPASKVLLVFHDVLASGVTNMVRSEVEKFLFDQLVPTLRIYDLVEDVKLPAKLLYREVRLSKKGRDFVAWLVDRYATKVG